MKGNILLDITKVDFCNANEVRGYAQQLIHAANRVGMFSTDGRLDAKQEQIRELAKEWVSRVESAIGTMSAGDALTVIYVFDIIHRMALGVPANETYLDKYKLRAFKAFIHRDSSVDQYLLFHALSEEIARRNKAYFGRPLEWVALCLSRWHKAFATGKSSVEQNDYDNINQVTALLCSDLFAFEENQKAYKRRLATACKGYFSLPASPDPKIQYALEILRRHVSTYVRL